MSYEYLFVDEIEPALPTARAAGIVLGQGVIGQHLAAYRRVQNPENMPTHLKIQRDALIRRTIKRQGDAPWWKDGEPTRAHLICIALAYTPTKTRYFEWLDGLDGLDDFTLE